MCLCCCSKGWGRVSIAITVSCHLWAVGVCSRPETWPSRSQTKNMFPLWTSLNVCFAIFQLSWLWPFRDGLSWQKGIDSWGKAPNLQIGGKKNHKDLCSLETSHVAVPQKQFWTKPSEISKAQMVIFPDTLVPIPVRLILHNGFLICKNKNLLEMFCNWDIIKMLLHFPPRSACKCTPFAVVWTYNHAVVLGAVDSRCSVLTLVCYARKTLGKLFQSW